MSREQQDSDCHPNSVYESWRIQSDASSMGFDWPDISGVFAKVREEIQEIQDALDAGNREHAKRELGDLLFATVNLARFLDADPHEELHRANERFSERFAMLNELLEERQIVMQDCSLEELDVVWEEVKRVLRSRAKKGA